jgi:hypothetical protein
MSATLEEAIEEVTSLPPEELTELRDLTSNLGELLVLALVLAFIHQQGKSDRGEVRSLLEKANSELAAGAAIKSLRVHRGHSELRRLAGEQGVKPFQFDQVRRDFWPQEESADDFTAWLRAKRDEGGATRSLPE